MKNKKLSLRMILTILAAQVIVLWLLLVFVNRYVSEELVDNALADMQISARDRANFVEQYVERCTGFLENFTKSTEIAEASVDIQNPQKIQAVQKYIDRYSSGVDFLEGVYLADIDTLTLAHNNPDSVNKAFREGDSLKALQDSLNNNDGVFCSGIVTAPVTKQKVLTSYCAVRDASGKCVGFTGAAFVMDGLASELDLLSKNGEYENYYSLINVATGENIFNNRITNSGDFCEEASLVEIMNKIKADGSELTYQFADGNEIASCYYMADRNWLFVVSQDEAIISNSVSNIRVKLITISVLSFVFLALMCGLSIIHLLNPLSQIQDSIENYAENRLEKHEKIAKYAKRNDEYGSLARAIEMLGEALQNKNEIYTELLKVQTVGFLSLKKDSEDIVLMNDEAFKLLGLKHERKGCNSLNKLLNILSDENAEEIRKMVDHLKENGKEATVEIKIVDNKGRTTYALSHGKNVVLLSGQEVLVFSLADITEKKEIENNLTLLSETDGLTGICNRRSGEEKIGIALSNEVYGYYIMFDVNKFKYVNDTFGHSAGDEVLIAIAKTMEKTFRASDVLVRLGGDEFVVFVSDVQNDEIIKSVIERFLGNISKINLECLQGHAISVSLGAVYCDGSKSCQEYYELADSVMYECKEQGGNAYRILPQESVM